MKGTNKKTETEQTRSRKKKASKGWDSTIKGWAALGLNYQRLGGRLPLAKRGRDDKTNRREAAEQPERRTRQNKFETNKSNKQRTDQVQYQESIKQTTRKQKPNTRKQIKKPRKSTSNKQTTKQTNNKKRTNISEQNTNNKKLSTKYDTACFPFTAGRCS